MRKYACIVADPPWPYESSGGHLKSSQEHRPNSYNKGLAALGPGSDARYGSMSIEELCRLKPEAEEDAHLYLWTTNAFMVEAHDVARAWGFKPKTILTWGKIKRGTPKEEMEASMKTGYYFRGATEHCLFCVRGSLPLLTTEAFPTLFLWPRLPHSVKPDAFFLMVEKCSPGPRLEMFARNHRDGWDSFGNQVPENAVENGMLF